MEHGNGHPYRPMVSTPTKTSKSNTCIRIRYLDDTLVILPPAHPLSPSSVTYLSPSVSLRNGEVSLEDKTTCSEANGIDSTVTNDKDDHVDGTNPYLGNAPTDDDNPPPLLSRSAADSSDSDDDEEDDEDFNTDDSVKSGDTIGTEQFWTDRNCPDELIWRD
jgi:hypothetical protein